MKNTIHTFAWIVSDNAHEKSPLLCYTGDLYYPQTWPWEDWGVQAEKKEERAPSNQRTRAGQNALCADGAQEETEELSSLWKSWRNKADPCEGYGSPPLLSAHFPPGPLLAQETDGEKHSCLDLIERGYQVKYFLHTDDGNEPKIHPGLCCYVCKEWGKPKYVTVPLLQNEISSFQRNKSTADCTRSQPHNFSHLILRGGYSSSWGTALPWLLPLSRVNPSGILHDASWADSCHQWAWFSCCCLPNDLFSNQEA